MEMAAVWRAFVDAAGPLAIAALWQGAALAAGLALCLRLTPRIAAADRFRAWAAGFAALVVLPLLPMVFAFFHSVVGADGGGASAVVAASGVAGSPAWFDLDPRWSLAIAAVWIVASLARVVDLGVHTVRLRRLWKRAVPIVLSEVVPSYKTAAKVEICSTRDLDRPSVIGFFAPRILIPEWLLGRLTEAEFEQVVLHEAEHLRRRDDWINLAQKLCLVVFPLNPALAWMERRLCREREMACDEGVVRRTQAPRAYAACLARLAERRLEREHGREHGLERRAEALSLGAWQRRPELVDRVHRILRRGPGLHPAAARALLGVVSCGLVVGSVELARCPQVVAFAARPAASLADMHAAAMVDGQPMRGFRAIDAVAHVPMRAELAAARMAQRGSAQKRAVRWSPTLPADSHSLRVARTDDEIWPRGVPARAGNSRRLGSGEEIALTDAASASHDASALPPQQWVVYTAWEQVESTSTVADQGAHPVVDQASARPRIARQFTVTQLILRVYPAGAMNTSAANSKHANAGATQGAPGNANNAGNASRTSTTIPITPLPAAIPIRGGWLVIQL